MNSMVALLIALSKSKKYTDDVAKTFAGGLRYQGSKPTVADLPAPSEANKGHLYTVLENGHEYVSDGTQWVDLSADVANKADKSYVDAELAKKQNKITPIVLTGSSGTLTDEQMQLLSDEGLAYILLDGKKFDLKYSGVGRSGIMAIYASTYGTAAGIIEVTVASKAWAYKSAELQEKLVSGSNIKTINNESLLGSGDIAVKTYQPFPSNWVTSGTLEEVVESMVNDPVHAKQGMAYLGGIYGQCTPFGYGNVELTVTFMLDGLAVLSVSSSNVAPYHWEYNTADGSYQWKKFSDVVANPSGSASDVLSSVSIDGTVYSISGGGGSYVAGEGIDITGSTISVNQTVRDGAAKGATAIQEHQSLADYYKKAEVYNKAEVDAKIPDISGKADKTYVDEQLATKQDIISDLETIRAGAAKGATALQEVPDTYRTAAAQDIIDATKQDKLVAGENVQINGTTISATDTTYTAGEDIAISADNVISATGSAKLKSSITSEVEIGSIKVGDVFEVGTSLESIIRKILTLTPTETVNTYYGATDNPPTDLSGLTMKEVRKPDLILRPGYLRNIVCDNSENGQHAVFAVPNTFRVIRWVAQGAEMFDLPYEVVSYGSYDIYYLTTRSYDVPGGINYMITIEEE